MEETSSYNKLVNEAPLE